MSVLSPPRVVERVVPRRSDRRLRTMAIAIGVASLLAACLIVTVWRLRGGTWRIVATPSMGRAAPVGTLLWIGRTRFADLRVGDFIAFHPPAQPQVTFTHRVVGIGDDGTLTTRGDLNGTVDAWHLHAADVIGKVDARWWDVGWLLRALPLLVVGALIVYGATRWCSPARWRFPLRIAGAGFVLSVVIYVLDPFVHADLVSFAPAGAGGRAQLVGTGILPLRATPRGGRVVAGAPGQLLDVLVTGTDRHGRYTVRVGAVVPWWWIALAAVVIFSPSIYRVCRAASSGRAIHRAAGG